jgi:hypothetical protein
MAMAQELDLESVRPQIESMNRRLSSAQLDYRISTAAKDLENLRDKILGQLDSRHFLFIKAALVPYYLNPDLFGPDVSVEFPEAIDDIEDGSRSSVE